MVTEEQFLKDVESHVREIIMEDGLYRHIRFRRPGTMCMHFDLITWPGYLCYTVDMGTYVFWRLENMFEFFRTDREYAQRHGKQLVINKGYWAQKLQAVDGNSHRASVTEFDQDRFKEVINEYRKNWIKAAKEDGSLNAVERRELWEEVEDRVLRCVDDGGERAQIAAYDFSWNPGLPGSGRPRWQFDDLFEHSFAKFTGRFMWCCYALAWGIQKYDEHKEAANAPEPAHA
ncbi:hypothetical protein [Alcaligenes sp. WGS1538]|uniref:hypothetical protein n=1 Tax=Alcaligenes sp. WGS1538 TaxID=3366811 RepID=UPI00372CFD8A